MSIELKIPRSLKSKFKRAAAQPFAQKKLLDDVFKRKRWGRTRSADMTRRPSALMLWLAMNLMLAGCANKAGSRRAASGERFLSDAKATCNVGDPISVSLREDPDMKLKIVISFHERRFGSLFHKDLDVRVQDSKGQEIQIIHPPPSDSPLGLVSLRPPSMRVGHYFAIYRLNAGISALPVMVRVSVKGEECVATLSQ